MGRCTYTHYYYYFYSVAVFLFPHTHTHTHLQVLLSFLYILFSSGKEFTLQETDDGEFFISAMKRCCHNHHDIELAYRIERLVNTGNNAALLGDSRLESMYYLFFMHLVCTFETMDKIMEVILAHT